MADYPISIDAVREMLIELRRSLGNERYISIGLSMALSQLEGFPQMDAVPVVRCKECKNAEKTVWSSGEMYCLVWKMNPKPNGYCYCGEKKDEPSP